MQILQLKKDNQKTVLAAAKKVLAAGGLVIFPTETTYGAGVLATSQSAVTKLLTYKSRREGKPLSIAVADQAMAEQYVSLNEQAKTLYSQLLPGPVTVVSLAKQGKLAPGVTSEFGTLGVRIPDYSFVLELVHDLGIPITATSANGSGKPRPYSIELLLKNLSAKQQSLIDLVIDAGTLPNNPPSTVIDTTLSTPVTLRQGAIAITAGGTATLLESGSAEETKRIAGQLSLQHWDTVGKNGLVFALDGPLGAGKTVFAQGVAQFLGIAERLTSPTYSYIQEYDFTRHQTKGLLYHCDLWKIDSAEACERLELEKLLGPNKIVVIEWFAQVENYIQPLLAKNNSKLVRIRLDETPTGHTLTLS
ncbi:MAG: threonylcarbamoyl-AMP synthase [Candidatus Pacebacteria bacterium]|nr:threonylcarbamoyl-AMP synthase [Candidatus Paceibacterota bacterium]